MSLGVEHREAIMESWPALWRAVCACGWMTPKFISQDAAEAALSEHIDAHDDDEWDLTSLSMGSTSLRARSGDATQVAKDRPATGPDSQPMINREEEDV